MSHAFPAVNNPDGTIDWTATARDYVVTLTVVDDNDPALSDSDTTTVHITAPPWTPVADADGPYTLYPCWLVTLDGSGSYDPGGELYPDPNHPWHSYLVSWEWDLDNDGEYDDATGETVTWSVCDLGVHVVGLKVTNSFGESDEVDTVVNVVEPPPAISVAFDIKPKSCPNPINTKDKGVLPVAVLGSETFDVTQIDPTSLRLEHLAGVVPLRWALEDVAAPYEPFLGKEDIYDCNVAGPDGFLDLTLKFNVQEVVTALGDLNDGDVLVLHVLASCWRSMAARPSSARMWSGSSRRRSRSEVCGNGMADPGLFVFPPGGGKRPFPWWGGSGGRMLPCHTVRSLTHNAPSPAQRRSG